MNFVEAFRGGKLYTDLQLNIVQLARHALDKRFPKKKVCKMILTINMTPMDDQREKVDISYNISFKLPDERPNVSELQRVDDGGADKLLELVRGGGTRPAVINLSKAVYPAPADAVEQQKLGD